MPRRSYFLKRSLFALTTVLVAASMNFVIFRAAPGDPVSKFRRIPGIQPEQLDALEQRFGLDEPLWSQYAAYMRELATGNLGISFSNSQPVLDNLSAAYLNTLPMVLLAIFFAVILGTAIGVIAAWQRRTALDHVSVAVALGLFSLPAQWLGLMLLLIFAGTLPSGGRIDEFLIDPSFAEQLIDVLRHMILPSATLGLVLFGQYALIVRSSMLETLGEDYILTARAKGLSNWAIVRKHALRNALLPVTTLIAVSLGLVVSGSILVETVFSWPGIGRVVYTAVLERDWPMLQGAFLIFTLTIVVLNFLADLLYFRLDPRISG